MMWSAICNAFRRLDDRLSDGVYTHGRYLTGQEKIVRLHPLAKAAVERLNLPAGSLSRMKSSDRDAARDLMR
ncbi:hypothetical protein Msil_1903 [Methylocella silvestris BL2]|uniref:Uncharacterized protein n=1 Tax=Methylocella silvestris (strain DSM 15510 / CIP 108128 / LMG 27833 / NCIMB 13906 / BL2) TaxID=395965 RepID=B8ENR2_METSB|nr:hypothetical protein [Methylocella silvestris]ACK50848.1 hypothetical protein Msil_1903 [Methylocella silvestris BL2]